MPPRGKAWRDVPPAGRAVEIELRGFDGTTRVFRGDLLVQGEGAGRRVIGVFVDGDDGKALRAAAQHSARMEALGSLTAGVAHDFNNLLTVLVGNLYLIGEELRERPRVFEKLKAARDAGKRGTELIKQLMTFARREELAVGRHRAREGHRAICCRLLRRAFGVRITLETRLRGERRCDPCERRTARERRRQPGRQCARCHRGQGTNLDRSGRRRRDRAGGAPARTCTRWTLRRPSRVRDTGGGIPPKRWAAYSSRFSRPKASAAARASGSAWCVGSRSTLAGAAAIESVVGQGTTVTLLLPRLAGGTVSRC